MNIAIIPSSPHLKDIFFDPDGPANIDGRVSKWLELTKNLRKQGHKVHTIDKFKPEEIDMVIILFNFIFGLKYFLDVIKKNPSVKIIYQMFEPELGEPLNNKKIMRSWDVFDIIYTYRDDYVDNNKFRKLHMHNYKDIENINPIDFKDKKFLCVINSLRNQRYPKHKIKGFNLYNKRIDFVKHFSKDKQIDIYGRYWKEKCSDKQIMSCYKGSIKDKKETLRNYKYNLCFENEGGIPGYISEKILDCFEAGVIPIYYGANNIEKYFPKGMFIDYRDYKSLKELEEKLKSITEEEYSQYIEKMKEFIKSEEYEQFKTKPFVNQILNDINTLAKKRTKKNFMKIKLQFIYTLITNFYISYNKKKRGFLAYNLTKW